MLSTRLLWAIPLLLALVVAGTVVPLLNRPLEWDEVGLYEYHLRGSLGHVLTSQVAAKNQLGFSVLAWLSMQLLGDQPWAIRLPALIAACMVPGAFYLLSRRYCGTAGALVVAAALTLNGDLLKAGGFARSYSMLVLGAVVSLAVFRRWLERPSARGELAFAASVGATATCHLWFLLGALAKSTAVVVIHLLSSMRRVVNPRPRISLSTRELYVGLLVGVALTVVLQAGIIVRVPYMLTQGGVATYSTWDVARSVRGTLQFRSLPQPSQPLLYSAPVQQALTSGAVAVMMIGLVGAVVFWRRDAEARMSLYLLAYASLLSFVVAAVVHPVYMFPRFFMYLWAPLLWTAARGWDLLLMRPTRMT